MRNAFRLKQGPVFQTHLQLSYDTGCYERNDAGVRCDVSVWKWPFATRCEQVLEAVVGPLPNRAANGHCHSYQILHAR